MAGINRQWLLAAHPGRTAARPTTGAWSSGRSRSRGRARSWSAARYLSVDPYMRGRISPARELCRRRPGRPGHDRRRGRRGGPLRASRLPARRDRRELQLRLAGVRGPGRRARAQGRPGAGADRERAELPRPAGADRLFRAPRDRPAAARRDRGDLGRGRRGRPDRGPDREARRGRARSRSRAATPSSPGAGSSATTP